MPRNESLSRRNFLKLAGAGVTVAAATRLGLDYFMDRDRAPSEDIRVIEWGEAKHLTYFEYSNQLEGFSVLVNELVLVELASSFNFPLRDPSQLKISMLPVKMFPNPPQLEYGHVDVTPSKEQSQIKFAGGRFIDEVIQWVGRPPADVRDEVFLSTSHSVALVFGHCELAALKGEMSAAEALEISNRYMDAVFNLELPELPSWVSIVGNPPPPDFRVQAGMLGANQVAFVRNIVKV